MKKLLWIVILTLAVGAGYYFWSSRTSQAPVPSNPLKPVASSQSPVEATPDTRPAAPASTSSLPAVDETWRTYTSKAGDFSFQWPTRGRYAPTWNVTFSDTGCSEGAKTLNVFGTVGFCHDATTDGAAGTIHYTDVYKTQHGKSYIQITFTKAGSSMSGFDEATYKALLDQIVGTFTQRAD